MGSADSSRIRVAIGPSRNQVSWTWVGEDPARELAQAFDVTLFDSVDEPPDSDVIVVIKAIPSTDFLRAARARGSGLIFVPVDGLRSEQMAKEASAALHLFDGFGLHCRRLASSLPSEGRVTVEIDHWNRFGLDDLPSFKEQGPIVWIGACEHIPRVLRWLDRHPLSEPIRILTNLDVEPSRKEAQRLAADMGIDLCLTPRTSSIFDHECAQWSERTQREWMTSAKAAFDIKGASYQQRHKPPTKAQQFIASGIPFAINHDAYAREHFEALGLPIPSPDDTERWLSRAYFDEIQAFARGYAPSLTLTRVARDYARLIRAVHRRPRGLRRVWARLRGHL